MYSCAHAHRWSSQLVSWNNMKQKYLCSNRSSMLDRKALALAMPLLLRDESSPSDRYSQASSVVGLCQASYITWHYLPQFLNT